MKALSRSSSPATICDGGELRVGRPGELGMDLALERARGGREGLEAGRVEGLRAAASSPRAAAGSRGGTGRGRPRGRRAPRRLSASGSMPKSRAMKAESGRAASIRSRERETGSKAAGSER